jgi:outer membrane receptor protein involved in Fe transport
MEHESGASLWSVTPYARYNTMGLLPSWQLSYDPQTWDTRSNSLGVLLKYRRDIAPLRARIIAGADADWSPGSFTARRAVTTATGSDRIYMSYTNGETQYDYAVTYRSLSPYLHAEASPSARLRFDAGLRYDASGYDYTNHLSPVDTGAHRRPASTSVSYRHLSPKVGATLQLMSWSSAFASYRHGFRAPSQGQLFQQNSALNTVGLDPVKVESYETGVRGQIGSRLVYQASAYDMTIRDDIITFVTAQNTREATNAGATRHRGVEVALGTAVTRTLRLDASWSTATQRYVTWVPQAATATKNEISYSGNRIEQAPAQLGSAVLTYTPALLHGGRFAVEWSRTGSYAMDPTNARSYGGYSLLNLHANAFLRPGIELFARAVNVADTRYAEVVTYDAFQKEQYTPGGPRSVYAGVKWGWK